MAGVTNVTMQPEVVALGGAVPDYYNLVDGATISEGDLVRICSDGTVELASLATNVKAGACHGIALEDGTDADAAIKVLKFAGDTYIKIQCADSVAPEDLSIGSTYIPDANSVTKKWAVVGTTANGYLTVVARAGTATPWTIARGGWDEGITTDNNSVIVKIAQSVLDTFSTAT